VEKAATNFDKPSKNMSRLPKTLREWICEDNKFGLWREILPSLFSRSPQSFWRIQKIEPLQARHSS
jgi:hypothetical protein